MDISLRRFTWFYFQLAPRVPVLCAHECYRLLLSGVAFILRNHRRIMGLVGLVTSTWTIVVIEMTIKVNDIRGVNELAQTSQLIPFVLGCALFLGTIRRAILQRVILVCRRLPTLRERTIKTNWAGRTEPTTKSLAYGPYHLPAVLFEVAMGPKVKGSP